MRNRILIAFLVLTLAALPFMAACAKPAPPPPAPAPAPAPAPKPIELRIANFQPPLHKSNEMMENWAKKIEAETGGKVKFILYPGETLAKAKATYDAAVTGVADVAWTFAGYSPGRFSLSEVTILPGIGFNNAEHAASVLWDLWEMFPEIREQYKDTHVLWITAAPNRQLFSLEAAPHVEDIEGMKIRVPGSEAPAVEAVGGIPISISGPEVYEALERGTLDGDFHPWETAISYRWYEIVKYATRMDFYVAGTFICTMNLGTWDRLPEDVQKVIDKYSGRHGSVEVAAKGMWDKYDQESLDWLKENTDLQFFEWTAEDHAKASELTKSVRDKWIADMEAKGLPGQKIYDECLRLRDKYK